MNYELIKYNENLPFKIFVFNEGNSQYHFHKELELIFVLKGTVIYEVKSKKHKLMERDLFLVNSFDMHSVISEQNENILLILQLDPLYFNQYCHDFSEFYYEANSILSDTSSDLYKRVSRNLANIMLSLVKLNTGYKLEAINSAIEIALTLIKNCRTELRKHDNSELHKQHRIFEILKYIEENYAYEIGLENLSKEILISPRYVSKFFKDNFGMGFVDYINNLRITKSLNDLLDNKKSILDIAVEHGFNDHRAYNRVFKKMFGATPSEYRTNYLRSSNTENNQYLSNFFKDNSNDYFKYLFEILENDKRDIPKLSPINNKLNIDANLTNFINKDFTKHWNKIANVERASLCLRNEIQLQIRTAQKELKYEFIRFHHIFSDEMIVYKEDSDGNPIYNWHYIDSIFDFFCEVNLKPFIEIGFMPEALASKKQYAPYFWKPNVSYPKSIKKWGDFVSEFIKHCIFRYGKSEVEKWYFEIWSAPELTNLFWYDSKESFLEFYKATYLAIKKVSSELKVGSPGVLPINNFEWFEVFLNYCKNNSLALDFASCHIYPTADPQNKTIPKEILHNKHINLSMSDENYLDTSIDLMKNKLAAANLNDLELFVTEWNLSPYTMDYTRDTCFFSSYIVRNMLNNINKIDGIGFWTLSDIMDQGITSDSSFHGGYGLFTRNRIKKPAFNGFYLLNKLGDIVVDQGKDYIITSKGFNFQILIYNYIFFDELFRTGDKSLLTYHERYNIFKPSSSKDVNIVLTLEEGKYKITRFILNRENGSSFDAWLDMGAPEEINNESYNYLKSKETPKMTVSIETIKKQLVLNDIIPVHGILLIEIHRLG